jgi:hypothetical protein
MLAKKNGTSIKKNIPARGAAKNGGHCQRFRATTKNGVVVINMVEVTATMALYKKQGTKKKDGKT